MKAEKIDICKQTDELRKLILENPDLPIVVLTHWEVCADDNGYWYGHSISFEINRLIKVVENSGDIVFFSDEEDFYDYVSYAIEYDYDYEKMTDAEWQKTVEEKCKEYEPLWTKCIVIYSSL